MQPESDDFWHPGPLVTPMHRRSVAALALLVALAGCAAPVTNGGAGAAGQADSTPAGTGGDAGPAAAATPGPAPADDESGDPPSEEQPDPESDRIGWEAGYWYNDPIAVNNTDGLDGSERAAVLGRAMARVELIRNLEFNESVGVSVVERGSFAAGELGGDEPGQALRTFDNAKFETLLLVGSGSDSIDTQEESLNSSVGGYYSTETGDIVIVADSGTPTLDGERTLAHELVHALQDQHFDSLGEPARTRDAYNGKNGLVEGDANAVQDVYMDRCGATWRCIDAPERSPGAGGDGSGLHMGVYLLEYFPYADGPSLIAHLRDGGDWSDVNAAYERVPTSATEVIDPAQYGSFEPRPIALEDDLRGGWERVRPADRPDHGRLGRSAIAASMAYTLYDSYNGSAVVEPGAFLNQRLGQLDERDPLNYDLAATRGWAGDRFHAYERDGDAAAVWRTAWENSTAAERFADGYRDLLAHWDAGRVGANTWRFDEGSPFSGSTYLDVDGSTVTVAKAPTTDGLGDVYAGAR